MRKMRATRTGQERAGGGCVGSVDMVGMRKEWDIPGLRVCLWRSEIGEGR
jgi:hypothetical protein